MHYQNKSCDQLQMFLLGLKPLQYLPFEDLNNAIFLHIKYGKNDPLKQQEIAELIIGWNEHVN